MKALISSTKLETEILEQHLFAQVHETIHPIIVGLGWTLHTGNGTWVLCDSDDNIIDEYRHDCPAEYHSLATILNTLAHQGFPIGIHLAGI